MKIVYFITNNHHDSKTIKKFFEQFKDVFSGVYFRFSDTIRENETNLILEEFSRFSILKQIENVKKKYPRTRIICIFSEYITKKPNTFNEFGKNKLISYIKVSFYFICYIIAKRFFDLEEKYMDLKEKKHSKGLDYLKYKVSKIVFDKYNDLKRLVRWIYKTLLGESIYMYFRYRGFARIEKHIDSYLSWNTMQKKQIEEFTKKKVLYLVPKINKISKMNERGITISGGITRYRYSLIKKLMKIIKLENNFNEFLSCKEFFRKEKFTWYSLNPGKNKNWPFPSLMRYVFSINNNEIPIVIKNYHDYISNFTSIFLEEKEILSDEMLKQENYEKNILLLNKKLDEYSKFYEEKKQILTNHFNEQY